MLPAPLTSPRKEVMSEDAQEALLDAHLHRSKDSVSYSLAHLYALHIVLCQLLSNRRTTERHLHDLLQSYPLLLDPHGASIHSEVRLGNKYRIDLAIQQNHTDKQITLIELENSHKKLFTKDGRLRSGITHALQQVEDWLRWWLENPNDLPAGLDSTLTPQGLVVVGRADNLTKDERQRLIHLNFNRRVQLITYDDLLDRVEAMIINFEQIDGEEKRGVLKVET